MLFLFIGEEKQNQRYFKFFRRFLERQDDYDWYTASFQGRTNYCKTNPDATFMHMKDDYMRNVQFKLGYNVQIAVDSEYIIYRGNGYFLGSE